MKVFKIEKRIFDEVEKKTNIKKSFVSIDYTNLDLTITKEQGARLTTNDLCSIILSFLNENRDLLNAAMTYSFRNPKRNTYVHESTYGATDYYIKFVTQTNNYVYSKFLFHETMSGFVLDKPIRVFLPDLLHLILDGALDRCIDFKNQLISIINNTDYNLEDFLYKLEISVTDVTELNDADLKELEKYSLIYNLTDLIK